MNSIGFVPMAAGYSGTPLWKKLGYAPGLTACVLGAPKDYTSLLKLPVEVKVAWAAKIPDHAAFVHVFTTQRHELAKVLALCRRSAAPNGVVWVSWPKKASRVPTGVTEDVVRELALPMGWVDVKVCAIDDTWSGLKLVIRRTEREPAA